MRISAFLVTATVAFVGGLFVAVTTLSLQGQAQPGAGFAAVPGEKGGWDITGPYDVVRDWPKPLSQLPSSVNFLYANGDGAVWAFEDPTAKVVTYDREGHLLYAWGALGDYPGAFLNMHGATVDNEGNLYVAEVGNGRLQKFTPRRGARPELLVGKPPVPRS